jgi:hypothetical protein
MVIIHRWICAECGNIAEHQYGHALGSNPPVPVVPVGWREFMERLVCDRHTVNIIIDGVRIS